MQSERYEDAFYQAQAAGILYDDVGDERLAIRANLEGCRAGFMAFTEVERLETIRSMARSVADRAVRIQDRHTCFGALVMAADCAWFAAEADDDANADDWLMLVLDHLHGAGGSYTPDLTEEPNYYYTTYVSLLGVVADRLVGTQEELGQWPNTEDAANRLDAFNDAARALAALAEWTVPTAFRFGADLDKSAATSWSLGQLSRDNGSAHVAIQRFGYSLHLHDPGVVEGGLTAAFGWLHRAAILHQTYDEHLIADFDRVPFCDVLLSAYEEVRAMCRTKTGRIWVTETLHDFHMRELVRRLNERPTALVTDLYDLIEPFRARTLLDGIARGPGAATNRALEQREAQLLPFSPVPDGDYQDSQLEQLELVSTLPLFERSYHADRALSRTSGLLELEGDHTVLASGRHEAALTVPLDTLERTVDSDELLVYYIVVHHWNQPYPEIYLLALARGELFTLRAPSLKGDPSVLSIAIGDRPPRDINPLTALVSETRHQILSDDDTDPGEALSKLWRLLIEPLEKAGLSPREFPRMVLVPHGPLHAVPFAALRGPDGNPLVTHTALTVAPSASSWALLRSQREPARTSIVALTEPATADGTPPLPASRRELTALREAIGEMPLVSLSGTEADVEALAAHAERARVLHIASHGEFPSAHALHGHAVQLAGPELTSARVRELPLRGCDLVYLNVCNGATYRFGPGDELYGLLPAFMEAGAANVLGTSWQIADGAASRFATAFYRHLAHTDVAEAVRRAALDRIAAGRPPREWAGFVLFGSGKTRPFS
ncbi:CHAT domain-containing protein [Streptomyces sp. NBC_01390]|uniref:CHAT domain-containing protein n=1 Tax=Streptomyces sp. NBC_01390 TaxID=2903850 RepID=UPI00324E639D